MAQFNIAEAKARFSELVEKALAGDEVVVARDNKPLLRLVPLGEEGRPRKAGSGRGQVKMSKDFDAPLPDFNQYPVGVALLLDTHAFLWWVEDSPRLSKKARAAIGRPGVACFVSVASCWEMAIKISLGRLRLSLADLPFHHRNPFDRVLAAQAIEEGLSLVSADPIFNRYAVKRVW